MQFKEKADVVSWDGQKVGQVDRVVLDPKSFEVTHLVVKKGFLFTQDKVIPIDRVETTRDDRVELRKGSEAPGELPDFEETHHILVEHVASFKQRRPEYARPFIWYGPLGGVPWRGENVYPGYPRPSFVKRTEQNIPDGTTPLEEGAKVVSKNGEHVGDVTRIYTEPEEQRVTHFLISKGLLSKEKKLIPTHWVDNVFEDKVHLSVESDLIAHLPNHTSSDEA